MRNKGQSEFWAQRKLQPKRKFRWIATIGDGERLYKYVVKKVTKPEWTSAEKEHKVLGHTFYYPGPVTWNSTDITFVDLAGNRDDNDTRGNGALFLQDAIFASGYQFPDQIGNATMGLTKSRCVSALGGMKVEQLNAIGDVLETYNFHNPWIQKVNFGGEFDYESDDINDLTITIRYDWAEIKAGDFQAPTLNNDREILKTRMRRGLDGSANGLEHANSKKDLNQ